MNGRKHTLAGALRKLAAKRCRVVPGDKVKTLIVIPRNAEIGNKTWGCIDYLCGEHGYGWMWDF